MKYLLLLLPLLLLAQPAEAQRGGWRSGDEGSRSERSEDGQRGRAQGDVERERTDRDREIDVRVEEALPWDWDEDERYERDERYEDRYEERYERSKKGKGPKFCRNGEGHPVHGRSWCREKGFSSGHDRYDDRYRDRYDERYRDRYPDPRWERQSRWEDIIFGRRDRTYPRRLHEGDLRQMLGDRFVNQLTGRRRGTDLEGRFVESRRLGRVLQLRRSGRPAALLVDRNYDGRIDQVLFNRNW